MAQLKLQLIDALIEMQKIPGMAEVLQPSINFLNSSSAHVPEDDYKKISEFKNKIFKIYNKKLTKNNLHHAKNLIELSQQTKPQYSKKKN